MNTRFPAIQELTTQRVRNVLRRATRPELDAEILCDFLASVDWGAVDGADPQVRTMLGQMEAWATEYAEGELAPAEYVARLLTLFPGTNARHERPLKGDDGMRGVGYTGALADRT